MSTFVLSSHPTQHPEVDMTRSPIDTAINVGLGAIIGTLIFNIIFLPLITRNVTKPIVCIPAEAISFNDIVVYETTDGIVLPVQRTADNEYCAYAPELMSFKGNFRARSCSDPSSPEFSSTSCWADLSSLVDDEMVERDRQGYILLDPCGLDSVDCPYEL
ncbi:MAG: hypothetical protein ABH846_04900 [Patescibacteria group bacterium]